MYLERLSFVKVVSKKKIENYYHFSIDISKKYVTIISRIILETKGSEQMTKQQTLICDILANVCDHLTAEEVFFRAREKMPNIAMGEGLITTV